MQTVILVGGLATRLRPLTETLPKAMLPVCGRPFLEYQIDLLRKSGMTKILLCVGYRGEEIEKHFGDGSRFGVRLSYSWEREMLLGTGGALRNAAPQLEDEFLVLYGDSFLMLDYPLSLRRHGPKARGRDSQYRQAAAGLSPSGAGSSDAFLGRP